MAIRTHHILLQLVFVHALVGGDVSRHFIILQDDAKNSLLRVSATGETVEVIADGVPGEALMQDASGNYDESLGLFRIDWNGKPSDLRLGGVARGPGRSSLHFRDSLLAVNTGKLTPDSENGFYFTEYVGTQSLFHLGPDGTISRVTSFRELGYGHYPVVYDEVSRTVITANSSTIASVNPNSPESGIRILSRNRALIAPRAIIWERQLK